ncbi:MAG: PHP domain-containing protein [Bacillus subtilis]|nr:PHP domain-containing protein [Bacillus subtilis]
MKLTVVMESIVAKANAEGIAIVLHGKDLARCDLGIESAVASMIFYYDLHVHTVLSPCADVLMTPNNLWNMATLKGLDFVAFVDHNSLKQLPMLERIGESYRALLLIGVEVALENDLHVLVYFRRSSDALAFDALSGFLASRRSD